MTFKRLENLSDSLNEYCTIVEQDIDITGIKLVRLETTVKVEAEIVVVSGSKSQEFADELEKLINSYKK